MKYLYIYLSIVSLCSSQVAIAQEYEEGVKLGIWSLNASYGIELPGGDLKDRFGQSLSFVLGSQVTTPTNWIFGTDVGILFGQNVEEDVLAQYRLDNAIIISGDGQPADVFLRLRGLSLSLLGGKIIPVKRGSQSGLRLAVGAGFLGHKIRFLDESQTLFQVDKDYAKGYDRLTSGFQTKQQIGWEIHTAEAKINGNILFEFSQGFTKANRTYQFDIGPVDQSRRLDLLYTIKATYMLPLRRYVTDDTPIYY